MTNLYTHSMLVCVMNVCVQPIHTSACLCSSLHVTHTSCKYPEVACIVELVWVLAFNHTQWMPYMCEALTSFFWIHCYSIYACIYLQHAKLLVLYLWMYYTTAVGLRNHWVLVCPCPNCTLSKVYECVTLAWVDLCTLWYVQWAHRAIVDSGITVWPICMQNKSMNDLQ